MDRLLICNDDGDYHEGEESGGNWHVILLFLGVYNDRWISAKDSFTNYIHKTKQIRFVVQTLYSITSDTHQSVTVAIEKTLH